MEIELTQAEEEFFNAYIEAAYFTDTGDTGQPDSDCELCEQFERESLIDCLSFFQRIECYLDVTEEGTPEQAGHDFWLTRNGHGVGFWDRDCYKHSETGYCYGDMFTEKAKCYGEAYFVAADKC